MRWIAALIALICLAGGASAQMIFTGEGYSTSQLQFFNGPTTVSFEPNVEKYWDSYISNTGNFTPAMGNETSDMDIWFNSFPLSFDKQIQLKSSSFTANVPVKSNLSITEVQSSTLKRDISFNFNQDLSWKYIPADTTLSVAKANGAPPKDSQGQIISQGIMTLFG